MGNKSGTANNVCVVGPAMSTVAQTTGTAHEGLQNNEPNDPLTCTSNVAAASINNGIAVVFISDYFVNCYWECFTVAT